MENKNVTTQPLAEGHDIELPATELKRVSGGADAPNPDLKRAPADPPDPDAAPNW